MTSYVIKFGVGLLKCVIVAVAVVVIPLSFVVYSGFTLYYNVTDRFL